MHVHRSNVTTLINELKTDHIITLNKRQLIINDIDVLEGLGSADPSRRKKSRANDRSALD